MFGTAPSTKSFPAKRVYLESYAGEGKFKINKGNGKLFKFEVTSDSKLKANGGSYFFKPSNQACNDKWNLFLTNMAGDSSKALVVQFTAESLDPEWDSAQGDDFVFGYFGLQCPPTFGGCGGPVNTFTLAKCQSCKYDARFGFARAGKPLLTYSDVTCAGGRKDKRCFETQTKNCGDAKCPSSCKKLLYCTVDGNSCVKNF
jgi:hypothetical protein